MNDFGFCLPAVANFWFAAQAGRPVIGDVVAKFLDCGDLHQGFARVRCSDCGHELFVSFSCKQRSFCPSCHQKRALNTAHHLAEEVSEPVPHRQFVFTIPKRFRLYFRYDRSLLGKLVLCAWRTVRDVYQGLLDEEISPGMVAAIPARPNDFGRSGGQTFGDLIPACLLPKQAGRHWHPHVHAIVTDGAFFPDGMFLPFPDTPADVFRRVWEHHVFRLLLIEGRIDEKTVASMRSWRYSGFSVHKEVFIPAGDSEALERLTQYITRAPFSQGRMLMKTGPDGKVIYRADLPAEATPRILGEGGT